MKNRLLKFVSCSVIVLMTGLLPRVMVAATPPFKVSADRMETLSADTVRATGHVVIAFEDAEIRTEKADIVTRNDQVVITTDARRFVVTKN